MISAWGHFFALPLPHAPAESVSLLRLIQSVKMVPTARTSPGITGKVQKVLSCSSCKTVLYPCALCSLWRFGISVYPLEDEGLEASQPYLPNVSCHFLRVAHRSHLVREAVSSPSRKQQEAWSFQAPDWNSLSWLSLRVEMIRKS